MQRQSGPTNLKQNIPIQSALNVIMCHKVNELIKWQPCDKKCKYWTIDVDLILLIN